jgi:hypothetical protein
MAELFFYVLLIKLYIITGVLFMEFSFCCSVLKIIESFMKDILFVDALGILFENKLFYIFESLERNELCLSFNLILTIVFKIGLSTRAIFLSWFA